MVRLVLKQQGSKQPLLEAVAEGSNVIKCSPLMCLLSTSEIFAVHN